MHIQGCTFHRIIKDFVLQVGRQPLHLAAWQCSRNSLQLCPCRLLSRASRSRIYAATALPTKLACVPPPGVARPANHG